MLTKSDFLTFLDAPMHLWAKSHDQIDPKPRSGYDQHLAQQGQQVEALAKQYLEQILLPGQDLVWQPSFNDGQFQIRADALVWDETTEVYDLYEIKSATSVQKVHQYDLAFQILVLEGIIPLHHTYLLHINKSYQHGQELELEHLFTAKELSAEVAEYKQEVAQLRQAAWQVTQLVEPQPSFACIKPQSCPCPTLCHPNLPENPIYSLPYLGKKAVSLRETGTLAIEELPESFNLNPRQRIYVEAIRTGKAVIDNQAIQASLAGLQYPLFFLDYETFNPAVPLFPGYHPYEHIVFQYSLFKIEEPGAQPSHFEAVFADGSDPAPKIVPHLLENIGDRGSILVWNQVFEAGRNKDLARRCPLHAQRLLNIIERLYDLMLIFREGQYVDPRFQGSASLKAVLPVLCSELQYGDLTIQNGETAMLTWYHLHSGLISPADRQTTIDALKAYCKRDTYGMVAIWEHLCSL